MKRYHKKIYFPDIEKLKKLNDSLNLKNWQYSSHALDNLKYRAIDNMAILKHIKGIKLEACNIFEYYITDDKIQKVCYRMSYTHSDIILVVSKDKMIISIYLNSKNDNHITLKENLYQTI